MLQRNSAHLASENDCFDTIALRHQVETITHPASQKLRTRLSREHKLAPSQMTTFMKHGKPSPKTRERKREGKTAKMPPNWGPKSHQWRVVPSLSKNSPAVPMLNSEVNGPGQRIACVTLVVLRISM